MSEEIAKYSDNSLINFNLLFNAPVDESLVETNKFAQNSKFIPIAIMEQKLDEFYSGLWSTENFRWQVVANEIIGSVDLKVFHPVAKIWIVRTGCASSLIKTKSGTPPSVENKISNTLVTDFPHMKAECIKNAAKSLGVNFGRNLNRKDYDLEYENIFEKAENHELRTDLIQRVEKIVNEQKWTPEIKITKIKEAKTKSNSQLKKFLSNYEN